MPIRIKETDVDGLTSTFIEETYKDEVAEAFLKADSEAGQEVDVIYVIDDLTGEDIECWRQDWMIERLNNDNE